MTANATKTFTTSLIALKIVQQKVLHNAECSLLTSDVVRCSTNYSNRLFDFTERSFPPILTL